MKSLLQILHPNTPLKFFDISLRNSRKSLDMLTLKRFFEPN